MCFGGQGSMSEPQEQRSLEKEDQDKGDTCP